MLKQSRILVTGGSGFVGSALVKRLVFEGYFVRVLDNNIRGIKSRLDMVSNNIDFIKADIRDYNQVAKLVKKSTWYIIWHTSMVQNIFTPCPN